MWGDADFRSLTPGAQWLYVYLLSNATLSYVGVADWRPKRIASTARALTAEQVERYAGELADKRFVIVDDDTEEICVRSFLRWDGLLLNPNMWKSVGRDFTKVASDAIRESIGVELRRLRAENPEGLPTAKGGRVNPWGARDLQTALDTPTSTPSETPYRTPSDTPSDRGSDTGSPPTPTPSPEPSKDGSLPLSAASAPDEGTLIPDNWRPNQRHVDLASSLHLDVEREAVRFTDNAHRKVRRLKNWNSGFTNWLRKQAEFAQQRTGRTPSAPWSRPTPDDRVREGIERGRRLAALADPEQKGITA